MGKVIGIAPLDPKPAAETFAEETFRLAVEACPNGMVLTDSHGIIVLVNAEAERLFGYRRNDLIGQPVEILVPERLREKNLRHQARFTAHPRARRGEAYRNLLGLRRDGSEFPIEIGSNPIRTEDGLFILNVIIDRTDRDRVDRLKDEFVSTVSHELRTPITSISGSLGLLIGGAAGPLPEAAMRLLTIAQSNSQRLVRLINDILDVEKIESGKVTFQFKRIELRSLVEQALEANRAFADGFGVRLRLDAASPPTEALADSDRLSQVVTNLLSNAIKFSPRGAEVVVTVEHHDGTARILVRDHGDGIPADFRPRVFEKFAQADATNARQKGGTGLGLSIVKQIVCRLGGKVGFADAEGGGTVFFVELHDYAYFAALATDPEPATEASRILLCENDPDAAMALREGLRPLGFCTDFAFDPAGAIARAQSGAYAAIICDLDLPDAEEIGLVRRLRQQPQVYKTPIIAVSANSDRVRSEAASLNVTECIDKPVDVDRLAQTLERIVTGGANGRPRILHVDDDHDVLELVACTLKPIAHVVSVDSVELARRALMQHRFDLAVLDIMLGPVSGLDLLPYLRTGEGVPIPVIIFSAHGAEVDDDPQVKANLNKAGASLDDLVAAVHDRLMLQSATAN